jgi:ubiquinol-cytochrome c reductase cytochrome b subunit
MRSKTPRSNSYRSRINAWLEARTGLHALLGKVLAEPIPGGAKFAYVFGSGLLFLFISQVVTGVFLSLYYCQSPDHAHTSIAYIIKEVSSGSFLRSVHAYGSSAMIIVLVLHIGQTVFFGSYKGKRELLWLSGCILFALVLAMAFTGYLLPWDQKAYFATTIGTNIATEIPGIGGAIKRLIRGGNEIGGLTLSRFFTTHVFLLPAAIFAFISLHVYLFRKAGAAGPISEDPFEPTSRTEPFYPRQVYFDLVFTVLLISVIAIVAQHFPAELGPVANPTDTQYLPRPEWYYRPIFQWLKYWRGPFSAVGILLIPLIIGALFALLPFLDRGKNRRITQRKVSLLFVLGVFFSLIFLGALSYRDDRRDPSVAVQLTKQDEDTRRFMSEAFVPLVSGLHEPEIQKTETNLSPQVTLGKKLYTERSCNACHGDAGQGTATAPKLTDLGTKYVSKQLAGLLKNPTQKMASGGMTSLELKDDEMNALIVYLEGLK